MSFNAKKARAKYALPMWVDAFVRKTLDLSADEIGGYNLLLWAMWAREDLSLPDDDRKLARIARTSSQTWKRRIRPALEPHFEVADGVWTSDRLGKEAKKTEDFLAAQSRRRSGSDQKNEAIAHHGGAQLDDRDIENNSGKSLETNDGGSTGDISTVSTRDRPNQETKSIGGGGYAHAREENLSPPSGHVQSDREAILEAIGADPISGMFGPNGKQIGRLADMQEARRWRDELGLGLDEVLTVIREVIAAKRDGPPNSFSYFTAAMQRFAGQKNRPALTPIEGGQNDQRAHHRGDGQPSAQRRAHASLASAFARTIPDEP